MVGFSRSEWIEYCEAIYAHDNAPAFRDEQRAFYDSARDLLASASGYRVVRIKDGALDWTSCDTNTEISKLCGSSAAKGLQIGARGSAARAVPQVDQGAGLVTVCIQGRPAQRDHTNTRRLAWLTSLIEEMDKTWRGLDAVVFPGGFLWIRTCIGDLDYAGRAKALRSAGLLTRLKTRSVGSRTHPAQKELAESFFWVRLWTQKDLLELLFAHYDHLDEDWKAELPLKRMWTVAIQE